MGPSQYEKTQTEELTTFFHLLMILTSDGSGKHKWIQRIPKKICRYRGAEALLARPTYPSMLWYETGGQICVCQDANSGMVISRKWPIYTGGQII